MTSLSAIPGDWRSDGADFIRVEEKNEEVKRDAEETRVSDISSAGKRMNEGKNQDKKLKGKAQQSFHETV